MSFDIVQTLKARYAAPHPDNNSTMLSSKIWLRRSNSKSCRLQTEGASA